MKSTGATAIAVDAANAAATLGTGLHNSTLSLHRAGVDGGTESIRAGVFDLSGTPLSFSSAAYPTAYPAPGWAEQNPGDWWAGLGTAVRQALESAGVQPSEVAAISIDTTCCTVVALDEAGAALRPALLWMDMRSAAQAAKVAACGDEALAVNSGGKGPVSAEWMVPKALWLKEEEPAVFEAAHRICEYQVRCTGCTTGSSAARPSVHCRRLAWRRVVVGAEFCLVSLYSKAPRAGTVLHGLALHCRCGWHLQLSPPLLPASLASLRFNHLVPLWSRTASCLLLLHPQDYINFHLTGRWAASVNNASVRWHYNTRRQGGWPAGMLQKLGLEALLHKWPADVLPLGAVVGGLTTAAAAHLGLPEGLPVAQGGAGGLGRVWAAQPAGAALWPRRL